jgi:hypothetical protein
MNPAVILALIADLYGQIIALQEQNAALRELAAAIPGDDSLAAP